MIASWLLDLTAQALHETPELDEYAGHVSDSGEGRWTVQAAVEEGVPAPVLAASLFDRFASRGEADFGDRVLSAMRKRSAATSRRAPSSDRDGDRPTADSRRTRSPRGSRLRRTPEPCALVIFGASGDLTHKKFIPRSTRSPSAGCCRRASRSSASRAPTATTTRSAQDMQAAVKQYARDPFRQDAWDELAAQLHYVATDFADAGGEDKLHGLLDELDEERATRRQPRLLPRRPAAGVPDDRRGARQAARRARLDAARRREAVRPRPRLGEAAEGDAAASTSPRSEIFRIDHYLGKETVQNMLALRFANGIFEPIWNRQFIDHVQITVAETIGIEGRAGYYEQAGAIRDIFQNHLLQLLALTAMEPPIDFTADSVRDEKVKVLRALAHARARSRSCAASTGAASSRARRCRRYREEKASRPTR